MNSKKEQWLPGGNYIRSFELALDNSKGNDSFTNLVVPSVYSFIRQYLTQDPDKAGDFLLYIYSRLGRFMETYHTKSSAPFGAYFSRCIRNEFFNFLRVSRSVDTVIPELPDQTFVAHPDIVYHAGQEEIEYFLQDLPLKSRVLLCLYTGIRLKSDEILYLIELTENPELIAELLRTGELRSQANREFIQQKTNRLAYLSSKLTRELTPENRKRYMKWKRNIEIRLERRSYNALTLSELATLFKLSKSTIQRRIQSCSRQITLKKNRNMLQRTTTSRFEEEKTLQAYFQRKIA